MRAEERRRLELLRLATEVTADVAALELIATQCLAARSALAQPTRPITAMVAVDLHRWYTAVENVIERIERALGALPPPGPSWHRDLLQGAAHELTDARPAIVGTAVVADLEELLAFRHFFRHAYTAEFDAKRLDDLVARLERSHGPVISDLRLFVAHLRATIATLGNGG